MCGRGARPEVTGAHPSPRKNPTGNADRFRRGAPLRSKAGGTAASRSLGVLLYHRLRRTAAVIHDTRRQRNCVQKRPRL